MRGMSARRTRHASNALFGLALLCIGYGAARLSGQVDEASPGPDFLPSQVALSVGKVSLPLGRPFTTSFILENRATQPVKVMGLEELCTQRGCIRAVNLPLEIAGRASAEVRVELRARLAGDFEIRSPLYTAWADATESHAIPVTVRGSVSPPDAAKPIAPPEPPPGT